MDKLVVFLGAKMLCHSFKEMEMLNLALDGLQLHAMVLVCSLNYSFIRDAHLVGYCNI